MCRISSIPLEAAEGFERALKEGRIEERGVSLAALEAGAVPVNGTAPAVPPPPEGCSEAVFQTQARKLFLASGFDLFYHTRKSKGSDEGFPDCVAGRGVGELVVAELKVGRNKPTKSQEKWLAFFRTIPGARVFVWYPRDWPAMVEALR